MASTLAGRGFVVGACLLTFLSSACTPSDPPPSTPSPSTSTPTETAQEREEREAYAAAETSYREFRAEYYRVLSEGGAKSATAKMKSTAAGPYLKEATEVVQAYHGLGNRSAGSLSISEVSGNGYTPGDLNLHACEDSSGVSYFNAKGKSTGRGELRTVDLQIRRVGGMWKIWSGTGKKVATCEN